MRNVKGDQFMRKGKEDDIKKIFNPITKILEVGHCLKIFIHYLSKFNLQSCVPHHISVLLLKNSWFYYDFLICIPWFSWSAILLLSLNSLSHIKIPPTFQDTDLKCTSWVNYFFATSHFPHSNMYVFEA